MRGTREREGKEKARGRAGRKGERQRGRVGIEGGSGRKDEWEGVTSERAKGRSEREGRTREGRVEGGVGGEGGRSGERERNERDDVRKRASGMCGREEWLGWREREEEKEWMFLVI